MADNKQPRGYAPSLFFFFRLWFEIIAKLEMPGVEPGSGKPRYQISTRLVTCLILLEKLQVTGFLQASLGDFASNTQACIGRYPTSVKP